MAGWPGGRAGGWVDGWMDVGMYIMLATKKIHKRAYNRMSACTDVHKYVDAYTSVRNHRAQ